MHLPLMPASLPKGNFDQYQFHLKNNDNNYVIYAIAGIKII